jgi:hypothetical protein
MTASQVLDNLRERGVAVSVEAGMVQMTPASVVTEDDLAAVKAVKGDIIRLLTAPAHGSAAWPMGVHAHRLAYCPWETCGGPLVARRELYLCRKCGMYFRKIEMEGVYE